MKIYNPAGSTHVVIDLMGTYIVDLDGVSQSGRFVATGPVRAFDTRIGAGFDIPLVANFTVTNTSGPGYLTVYPKTYSVPAWIPVRRPL